MDSIRRTRCVNGYSASVPASAGTTYFGGEDHPDLIGIARAGKRRCDACSAMLRLICSS
jgi:hypothetical protein